MLAAGCGHGLPAKEEKPVEVIVTTPVAFDKVVDYQDYTGRLEAMKTIEVRARVSGYLEKSYLVGREEDSPGAGSIKEGAVVNKGDLLFMIDQKTYKAAVAAAKATVAQQEANLKLARVTYARSRAASGSGAGFVAPLELDQNRSSEEQAQANLDLARANLATAEINLDYTEVRAPIKGRVSRRLVDERNVVVADNTMLTTIVSEDPVYAYFDVDERTYLELLGQDHASQSSWMSGLQFPVMIRLANDSDFSTDESRSGIVDFIDNRVNGNTGTVRMRGVFKNPSGILKAGLFVRIRLPIGRPYRALLIPDEALQSDQGKKYVYVVKTVTHQREDGSEEKTDIVEYRPVQLGQAIGTLRVIKQAEKGKEGKEGLAEGERVIVVGMQRVKAKAKVIAKLQPPPEAPKSSLANLFNRNPVPTARGAGESIGARLAPLVPEKTADSQ
jgi:multidrug efflux system membrane fusion protein